MTAPTRTCVGCRGTAPKDALIRIAAGPDHPRVDRSGGAPGRGAYVHLECGFDAAALERALRMPVTPQGAARLRQELERE